MHKLFKLYLYKLIKYILQLPRVLKKFIAITIDVSLCSLSTFLAYYLRLGDFFIFTEILFLPTIISIVLLIPILFFSGMYKRILRYGGLSAIVAITRSMLIYSLLFSLIVTIIGVKGIPATIGIIQPLLLFLGIAGSRLFLSYWYEGIYKNIYNILEYRIGIYGAGAAGRQVVESIKHETNMEVVCFFDDDLKLQGQVLDGFPIISANEIPNIIERKKLSHIFLAIPSLSRRQKIDIVSKISKEKIIIRTLPSLSQIALGKVSFKDIRDLDVEEIIHRNVIGPNKLLLSKTTKGKIVLVTGAGGSIGSQICRDTIKQQPKALLLLEKNEFSLYTIHLELQNLILKLNLNDSIQLIPLLASVRDKTRIQFIIDAWKPNTIYHAAAYKHVPLVESNLSEGIQNNIFGTINIADIAIKNNVDDFVFISTDKAVRPTNAMGASKRVAEIYLQSIYDHHKSIKSNCRITKFSIVRFGNVLNSSGSVFPQFRNQIINGGPITLTHPEVTRYFMTIPEASQLVIQAGSMAKGGEIFILDMGEPVKILDLAKKMIQLSGLTVVDENNIFGDIEIKTIGLRPGEKLYEELLISDNPQPTLHKRIMMAQDPFLTWSKLKLDLKKLKVFADLNQIDMILPLLEKLVVGYKRNSKVVDTVFTKTIVNNKLN
mgnify:CR=1 FL=1